MAQLSPSLLFLILVTAGKITEGLTISDDEVTDNVKAVKDPIVGFALKIFQSLEMFDNKNSGYIKKLKKEINRSEKTDNSDASSLEYENLQDTRSVEYPRKYILVKDYQTVLGYKNIGQEQEEGQLKISQQLSKNDPIFTVAPFHFNFRFFSENTPNYDKNYKKQKKAAKENLSGKETATVNQIVKNIESPRQQLPQMQLLGQPVEIDSFWDFDRELGV